jgi:hypothetical protein
LYNGVNYVRNNPKIAAVRRYALAFNLKHPAPDWIEFKDLRQLDEVEMETKIGDSPIAAGATRTTDVEIVKIKVRPWTWGDVVWHYNDGTSVVYPAYEKIDWDSVD